MFYQKKVVKIVGGYFMEVEPVPSIDLRCRVCEMSIAGSNSENCTSEHHLNVREDSRHEDYLWLVKYFETYRDSGIWSRWIQDSLNMRVMYYDMSTVV